MYTVQQVSKMMNISAHTLRYYDNEGLFPFVSRSAGSGARVFSDDDLQWVYTVQCFRMTDMPLADIKHYIDLCVKGDETIAERYEIIKKQSGIASKELDIMQERVKMLEKKVDYYKALLDGTEGEDYWNPIYRKLMRCLAD